MAFTQYLRVGLVALSAPLIASLLGGGAPPGAPDQLGAPSLHHVVAAPSGITQVLVLVAVCVVGAQAGTRLRPPSPVLLEPMLLTALLTLTDTFGGFAPAGPLRDVMFVVIGLEVGLRSTRAAVRHVRKLLPAILVTVLVVCAVCAGLAWLLGVVEDNPFACGCSSWCWWHRRSCGGSPAGSSACPTRTPSQGHPDSQRVARPQASRPAR